MLKEIVEEVERAIDNAYIKMANEDYNSYILLIGRADIMPVLKGHFPTEYVIDYQLDRYYDETREGFYIRYLNRNYRREGFHYEGDEGIDDLSIEMMIYDHLWDSSYFLKSLVRIAAILTGKGYIWEPGLKDGGKWEYINREIIEPLKEKGFELGTIVEKGYSTDIRNAFAHSLYNINKESRTIVIRPRRGCRTISFEEFQKKFLYSVILMNRMQNALELNHERACQLNGCLTEPFLTPDGVKVQILAEIVKRGNIMHPEFKMIRIVE